MIVAPDDRAGGWDRDEVGGKAASLLELVAHGLPVPVFFVVTAEAHRRAVNGRLDEPTAARVEEWWHRLDGPCHRWAVRSSGAEEDSETDSFAGVFDTILDVEGIDGVLRAIERCWSSYDGAVARAYRDGRGSAGGTGMAVVVQRMVDADWSGVLFTADPVRSALSVSIVNAVAGVGEALVSGTVNPEEIHVDARSGAVLRRRGPAGAAPLPASVLRDVVELGRRCDAIHGLPQDVEWAAVDGVVQLLQSRTITTVAGVALDRHLEPWADAAAAGTVDPDAEQRLWTRAWADETWTPPVSPLFYDVQNLTPMVSTYFTRHHDPDPAPPDVFKYHDATVYADAAVIARMYRSQPRLARRPGVLNMFPVDDREAVRAMPWDWRGRLRRTILLEVRHRRRWSIARNHRFLEARWSGFVTAAAPWPSIDLASLTAEELDAHLQQIWATAATIGAECGIAVTYHALDLKLLLTGLLDRWCGAGEDRFALVTGGLDDSATVDESQRLWDVAERITSTPAVVSAMEAGASLADVRLRIDELGCGGVLAELDAFLRDHGHRGATYKDLVHPRWGDDPERVWSLLRGFVRDRSEAPSSIQRRAAGRRRAAQSAALADVRGPGRVVKRFVLRRMFAANETYAALRDNHRLYYDRVWWALRRHYLEVGRRRAADGLLSSADDVFFLDRRELAGLDERTLPPEVAARRITSRRAAWQRTSRIQPPKFLRAGYAPVGEVGRAPGDSAFVGLPASPGTVTGIARIAHDVAELDRVMPGDVLVARQTDPGWTPVFSRLGGLVLETGGVLAHGASLCREYGLPCVTVVERATTNIPDGAEVMVDGTSGRVTVISEPTPSRCPQETNR